MKKIYPIIILILLTFLLVSCNSKNNSSKIQTYTRDTSSGTREAFFNAIEFKEAIKNDSVLAKNTLIVDGNGEMISKIKNDKNAIGYISLSSYKNDIVKGLNINDVEPTYDNVLNGSYTLTRSFEYIITKNNVSDADKIAYAFQAYLSTLDAKLIIKSKGGIVAIDDSLVSWDSIKEDYPITLKNNSKVVVRFGGSTSVESIGKALSVDFSIKAGNFKSEHNYTGSSAAFSSTQGNEADGNNLLHVGFSSRKFNNNEIGIENTFGQLSLDAIVTIVNSNNSINNLSVTELKDVYSGKYDYFNEVKK